jgi:two-component system, OmpR family, KDP operon response regulator KdpE
MSESKILIIDDENSIRRLLRINLESQNYRVVEARDGREGIHFAAAEKPQLIILDMGLPDRRGSEILKEIRAWSDTPIIILSVENTASTIIEALDLGADDYVTKPFSSDELLARIRVCLRRVIKTYYEQSMVSLRHLTIDLEKRLILKNNENVHLTVTEYELFLLLLKNKGKVLTQNQILKSIWGGNAPSENSYPRVYIRHLRNKLENNPEEPELILTETGIGYRLIE